VLEIGQEIYEYRIKLDFIENEATKKVMTSKIIGLNEKVFCIDDEDFSRISIKKDPYKLNPSLSIPNCYHFKSEICQRDRLEGYIFTASKMKKKQFLRVKKCLEAYIDKNFSRYIKTDLLDKLEI
jgi:hypothetical protein